MEKIFKILYERINDLFSVVEFDLIKLIQIRHKIIVVLIVAIMVFSNLTLQLFKNLVVL